MKIAYVTPFYNGECDGRFGRFHDWVHTLRDMDDRPFECDVHAAMAVNPDGLLTEAPSEYLGDAGDLWATKRNNLQTLLETPRLYRELQRSDADIVHLVAFDSLLFPPVLTAANDTPLVLGPNVGGWYPIRDDDLWLTGPVEEAKLRAKYFLRKQLIRRVAYAHVLAFSDYHRQMLELLDIRGSAITPLRPGVDPIFSPDGASDPPASPYELLYVGDLSDHKGYPLFLRAVGRLDRDVRIRVIGAGDPDRGLIRSLGLESRVTIEGFVPRADLPRYYRSADLIVLPTIDETAGPNTQIEALACGTPVVTTDRPSMNEYAPEDAAILFWPREPRELADAIERALADLPALRGAARRHAPEFGADRTVAQLSELYERVLADHRGRSMQDRD